MNLLLGYPPTFAILAAPGAIPVIATWVCLKMLAKPHCTQWFCWSWNPYEKWLFHWEPTQHFQTNPYDQIMTAGLTPVPIFLCHLLQANQTNPHTSRHLEDLLGVLHSWKPGARRDCWKNGEISRMKNWWRYVNVITIFLAIFSGDIPWNLGIFGHIFLR